MLPKTCCCGRSLGTGTKIVAILTIIFSVVLFSFGLFVSINDNKNPIAIVFLVWPTVYIVLAILLLVGVSQKKPFYILPWLSISTIQIILCPIIFIWISVLLGTRSYELIVKVFLGIALGVGIPLTAVGIVFLIVVFSYYKEQRSTAGFTPFVTKEDV